MVDEKKKQQEWLNFGRDYLVAARTLANASGAAAPIMHCAWQAVEDDLKALSVGHTIPTTHDLGEITNHLLANSILKPSDLTQLSSDFSTVTGNSTYSDTKYPDNNPSYWSSLPRSSITNAISAAEHIHSFVLETTGCSQLNYWPKSTPREQQNHGSRGKQVDDPHSKRCEE